MVARRPLVNISGQTTELPPSDSVIGGSVGSLTAGSGLSGGGSLANSVSVNVSLAPNPSGLIFVGGKLGVDGAPRSTASTALASGNFALATAPVAIASGIAGSALAATAQASGNAALAAIAAIPGGAISSFTAASAIASGYAVGLDGAGRVQAVRNVTSTGLSFPGSAVVFSAASTTNIQSVYDSSSNRIVNAYTDNGNSGYGTAVVGTVSGTSISFGTPVVFESASTSEISSTYDSTNNKTIISYRDGGNSAYGTSVVGTVSGSSISFGTPVVFESAATLGTSVAHDSANNKIVIAFTSTTDYGRAVIGTVSGTSISFGTPVVYNSASTSYSSVVRDVSNNKIVIFYRNGGNSNFGTAIVGTISGTSISFGTPAVFQSIASAFMQSTYDPVSIKVAVFYYTDATTYGTAAVGTVSGTSISFGTPVIFESATTIPFKSDYCSSVGKIAVTYSDFSAKAAVILGAISGTSISFDPSVTFFSGLSTSVSAAYNSTNDAIVVGYRHNANSNYGTAKVGSLSSTVTLPTINSQNNFIGIAQTTAASGSAVRVRLPGSYDQNNTGLTPGAVYYVNPTTSGFTTTATQPSAWSGAINWGPVGRAVNSTTLLLTDMI